MRVKNLKPPEEGPDVEPPASTSTPPGVGADGGVRWAALRASGRREPRGPGRDLNFLTSTLLLAAVDMQALQADGPPTLGRRGTG